MDRKNGERPIQLAGNCILWLDVGLRDDTGWVPMSCMWTLMVAGFAVLVMPLLATLARRRQDVVRDTNSL
jgi:peptidoglycan/LPS O-acetylase OafA/YrhL